MTALLPPDMPDGPESAFAALGRMVANTVYTSRRLGHASLKMTAHYMHSSDPFADLVHAVAIGKTDDATAALDAWVAFINDEKSGD